MKAFPNGPSVFLCFVFSLPRGGAAEPAVLFSDAFDYVTSGSVPIPGSTAWTSSELYSVYTFIYPAGGSVKLGKTGESGMLTTTNLTVRSGLLSVQVDALGWDGDEKGFMISAGNATTNLTCTNDKSTPALFETFSPTFETGAGVVTVTFWTETGKRIFLDNIRITHEAGEGSVPLEFFVYPHSDTTVPALTEISFTIEALADGVATNVAYAGGLPAGALYAFTGQRFAWTPELHHTGEFALVFMATDTSGAIHQKTIPVTVTPLALHAPNGVTVTELTCNAACLAWEAVPAASHGYRVSAWYGSTAPDTLYVDGETFFEILATDSVAAPTGWWFQGVTEKYATADFVELKFNDAGDSVTTKRYPAPVSSLSFRLKGYATSSLSNSLFEVYGSCDGDGWTLLRQYSTLADADGDDENNLFTSAEGDLDKTVILHAADGFRQFRFVYGLKACGNIGLANVTAVYAGSGARFVDGWQATPVSDTRLRITGLPPAREILIRVEALDAAESRATQLRLTTPAFLPKTILMLR